MRIKPDYNLKSIYDIDLSELKLKGIKIIMFDLDSTLMVSKSGMYLEETKQYLFYFSFSGPHPRHMEVPRLGVKSELQLPAYTTATATATATPDPSCVCNIHHSSQQHWTLNPLSEARDPTGILMDPSQVR